MKYVIYSTLLLSLLFGIISAPGRLIKVRKIVCNSQFGGCEARILDSIRQAEGLPLYKAKERIGKYLESEPQIDKFSEKFIFPETIVVNTIERKAYCAVAEQENGTVYLIDSFGKVLKKADSDFGTPLKIEQKNISMGENLGEKVIFGCKIIKGVNFQQKIIQASIEKDELTIDFEGGVRVIFPVEGDIKVMLGSITLIFNRIKLDTLTGKVVDLRFKDPIIRQM